MGERNACSFGFISRNFLFFLITITSMLFSLSWFFVLRSTGRPRFIDHSSMPNSVPLSVFDNGSSKHKSQNHGKNRVQEEELPQKIDVVKCNKNKKGVLKVYMYDLPPEFHFELLGWKSQAGSVWPDIRTRIPRYPGGLNLQHSIEYWLTLDLLASELPNNQSACGAIRVLNSSEADIIFVPFFSSLSYNKYSQKNPQQKKSDNKVLQEKVVIFVKSQEEWKRSGGVDHLIVAHHPNSMLDARTKLWPAMFILADFGSRPILLYFQGAIYRKDGGSARRELFYLLKDEKDVHFSFGSVQKDGIHKASQGMHSSKFCLNIAGDTPSSNRLFDAIASLCVPVIISDEIELPYEDILDYSKFCIFVRTSDAVKEKFLMNLIRSIKKDEWTRMRYRLKEVQRFFEFQFPSEEGDAVQMIWQAVARKVPARRRNVHKSRRFSWTVTRNEKGLKSIPSPRYFW